VGLSLEMLATRWSKRRDSSSTWSQPWNDCAICDCASSVVEKWRTIVAALKTGHRDEYRHARARIIHTSSSGISPDKSAALRYTRANMRRSPFPSQSEQPTPCEFAF
jgi:hypothetical protein